MVTRDQRRQAERLWRSCLRDGQPDPADLGQVAAELATGRPRGWQGLLAALGDALRRYRREHAVRVITATPLTETQQQELAAILTARGVRPDTLAFEVSPTALAGLRVTIGYDVYDDSVGGRIERLAHAMAE